MRTITSSGAENISIGELSKHSGANIETIRYYERIKMLPPPPRTASGRRVYGPAEKRTLAFIRRSRDLGFTLEETKKLIREALEQHLAAMRADGDEIPEPSYVEMVEVA